MAQFKKAMIVLGNKNWKQMTDYFPDRTHKQLFQKYKQLGGSWGPELKVSRSLSRSLSVASSLCLALL